MNRRHRPGQIYGFGVMTRLTRRQFIGAAAGMTLVSNGLALPVGALSINPRDSWATNRPPRGTLHAEDVRFLLVHHSASRNGHTGAEAPAILRGFYDYHTGPVKGWSDIAYNFLIDADGGVWEGRAGSLDGAVAGDATGGNQGYSQLVCLIGDYNTASPSPASKSSLVLLLAWLADRYGVSTAPGAQVTFISRGSNLWPPGASVTTPTITGHRAMSRTSCPGENLNAYVTGSLIADVQAARTGSLAPTPISSAPTIPAAATISTTPTTPTPSTIDVPPPANSTTSVLSTTAPLAAVAAESGPPTGLLATSGAILLIGAGLAVWRHRRMGTS